MCSQSPLGSASGSSLDGLESKWGWTTLLIKALILGVFAERLGLFWRSWCFYKLEENSPEEKRFPVVFQVSCGQWEDAEFQWGAQNSWGIERPTGIMSLISGR